MSVTGVKPKSSIDETLTKINAAIKNLNKTLSDTLAIVNRMTKDKRRVFYKCNDCGNVGYTYKHAWRRQICIRCGSRNLSRLTPEEFVEEKTRQLKEEYSTRKKYLMLLRDFVAFLKQYDWYKDKVEFRDVGWGEVVFEEPSYITYNGSTGRDKEVYVLFHYFGKMEKEVLDKLVELAKKYGFNMEVVVDGRLDHCRFSKEDMEKMGFRKSQFMYYKMYVKATEN